MLKKEGKKFGFWNVFDVLKKIFSIAGFVISGLISLFMLFVFFSFFGLLFGSFGVSMKEGNIEVIPIQGIISSGGDLGLLGEKIVSSDRIVAELKSVDKKSNVEGVIVEINSPGGSPVATFEIANAVKSLKKPVVSVIRETGASGGFWVATSANRVFANPLSVTGSIGVLASHLEFAGLLNKYNITYRRLVAGKYKDAGSPYKEMSIDEQKLYQKLLDKLHEEFIFAVAQNRKMPVDKVREFADGFVMLGGEAKERGFVDELGSRDDAIKYLEQKLNITASVFEFKERGGLKDLLAGVIDVQSFWFGRGFGSAFLAKEQMKVII